jgi:hypothetical protein
MTEKRSISKMLRYTVRLIHYEQIKTESGKEHIQIAYGIVLDPDTIDEDSGKKINLEDLVFTAHYFMSHYKEIRTPKGCTIVESYVVPADSWNIGAVPVKKHSWVIAFKISDPKLSREIESDGLEGIEITLPTLEDKRAPNMTNDAGIQELKLTQNVGALIGLFRNRRDARSKEARDALVEIGRPVAAAAIRSWLLDEFAGDALQAAYLLVDICGSGAIEPLASFLLNGNNDIILRDFIPSILSDLRDERAVPPLTKLLMDEDETTMLRVFAGAALEKILPWERIDPQVREVITEIGPTVTKSLTPITSAKDVKKMLEDGSYNYPLYAFLLYTEVDKDFARFVRSKGRWLHDLSGEQCLISAFENPKRWGDGWKDYWREKIGSDEFDLKMMKWAELTAVDRDNAFRLAESLDLDKNLLPCIVFVDLDSTHEIMSIPVISDPAEYESFFKDLFTAVTRASQEREGEKLRDLKKAWRIYSRRWSAHQKAKLLTGKMKEWGSVLKELDYETTVTSLLISYAPLLYALAVQHTIK